MEILNQSNERMMILLGRNPFFKNKKYRLNKYCFIHDYKGVKVILNELTRSVVAMSNEEFSKIYDIENAYSDPKLDFIAYLIDNFFLVLEDYNEAEILDSIREKMRVVIDDKYLKECYDFIIFPTTTCNARCFYCYENPMKKMPMTIDMADRVTRYIMKKAPNKDRELNLRWFGGEPTFNLKVMRYIMNMVKANGYKITTSIISNAYLFNEKLVKEAIEEWNLNHIQITLDGTEQVYNKAKNYIYKNQDEVSPFKKVMENIGLLCETGISVCIRMNTDMHNVEDLKILTKTLYEKFGKYPNFMTYCYALFEEPENPRTDEERKELYTKMFELEDLMVEYNLFRKAEDVDSDIQVHHCMADNGACINIHPDGTLGVCEHYIDSDNWGYIDEDSNEVITNWENIHDWREYLTDDDCKNCPIYPTCIRVKKCTSLAYCHKWYKEFRFRRERFTLEGVYDKLLRFIEENNSCCDGDSCTCGNGENSCCATPEQNSSCYCISQVCDNKENWCYCISQQPQDNGFDSNGWCYCVEQGQGLPRNNGFDSNGWCYCVEQGQGLPQSQVKNKPDWCKCIAQQVEPESCKEKNRIAEEKKKKESENKEKTSEINNETIKNTSEESEEKKSIFDKIKDIFD